MKSLSDILKKGGSRNRRLKTSDQEGMDFLTLIDRWQEIVGERLAKHTIPLKNQRKKLTILTDHSAFSQQLSFMEDILIKKIFSLFPEMSGQIKGLNFQTNSSFFEKKHQFMEKRKISQETPMHKYSPLYKELSKTAEHIFEDVDDEDMKESLKSLFIQSTSRRSRQ